MEATKTIKIPAKIHTELKVFVAKTPKENMEDIAGYAITYYLKKRGHVFIEPQVKLKK
jgi:hypothetical protein